jgi:PAS domain
MVSVSPPVEIVSPFVRELFAYWQRRSAGRLAPRPRDIEPGDIKRLLAYVSLSLPATQLVRQAASRRDMGSALGLLRDPGRPSVDRRGHSGRR